ncbi:hypothetical protein Gpo141_00001176 [Globisporangium polare]
MAHLSARHGDARRRRDELFRERSLAIATKTGYPIDFQTKRVDHGVKGASATKSNEPGVESGVEVKRFTAEELAEATRRCQDRIHSAREKEFHTRHLQWQQEQEKQLRSEMAGHEAPGLAAKRLRDRKIKERQLQEESINSLITQQPSSIEAMNIARMLSPRFEERVVFTPSVVKHSVEDERVKQLLGSARVGSYYQ